MFVISGSGVVISGSTIQTTAGIFYNFFFAGVKMKFKNWRILDKTTRDIAAVRQKFRFM
jgi:hypothetical protein